MRNAKFNKQCAESRQGRAPLSERGFTMVEIAFSLAIVAFALVAIMGVLPTGMNVQKDNHDDTIVNNDGQFWLESLKSGSKGIDDLVNYVEAITITNSAGQKFEITNSFGPGSPIYAGAQIVSLLTTQKVVVVNGKPITNYVSARVRALNGAATEKVSPTNDLTFRYLLQSEVIPTSPSPTVSGVTALNLNANLQELKLTMRWPIFQQGQNWVAGRNKKTVRGTVNGPYRQINWTDRTGAVHTNNYFIDPNVYAYVQDPLNVP